ncbi:MAG: hypothetical protein CL916_12175 [Deltaproteobacteria bacterium]|nr:hypothetical protein [Deltaproteobacteria bacterium]
MALFGLRSKVKTLIKDALQLNEEEVVQNIQVETPVEPTYQPPKEEVPLKEEEPVVEKVHVEEEIVATEETTTQSVQPAAGRELTPENVQEILDDDVRPALQMDGGDIELVKVENENIYVRLVGACSTCPSSVMTMRMGVENLLREEFPSLNELVEVTDEAQES